MEMKATSSQRHPRSALLMDLKEEGLLTDSAPAQAPCTPDGFGTHPKQPNIKTTTYRCNRTDRSQSRRQPSACNQDPDLVLAK